MSGRTAPGARGRFVGKVGAALGLALLAERTLFDAATVGWTLGLVGAAGLAATLALRPAILASRLGCAAAAIAGVMALLCMEQPTPLVLAFFLVSLWTAALAPRAATDDAWRWLQRLAWNFGLTPFRALADLGKLQAVRQQGGASGLRALLPSLAVPALGLLVFVCLFGMANPVIAQALDGLLTPQFDRAIPRIVFAATVAGFAWSALRARSFRRLLALPGDGRDWARAWITPASVLISLVAFNLLFAVQNGLDLAFLWSGASLPAGVSLAEYAHRGAYPLIVTALLAALFVLVALRPGSETARRQLVRWLVVGWIAQNILLVASSILRTLDYVDAYSLTRFRIAALAWMVLVAVGLGLTCWRLLRDRSGAWLVNANVAVAGLVLAASAVLDLGAIAATWNVRHAKEMGGRGAELDVCYLRQLGPSALTSLAWLEGRQLEPALRGRVAWARIEIQTDMQAQQGAWREWTWRDARRLAAVGPAPQQTLAMRYCDGRFVSAPEPAPLTAPAQPGT